MPPVQPLGEFGWAGGVLLVHQRGLGAGGAAWLETSAYMLCHNAAIGAGFGGLSAAKGLSEAGGVGLIAVSRLALLAAAAGDRVETVHAVLYEGLDPIDGIGRLIYVLV